MVCNVIKVYKHITEIKEIVGNETYTKVILLTMKEMSQLVEKGKINKLQDSGCLWSKNNVKSLTQIVHQQKEIQQISGLVINNKTQNILKNINC